MTIKAVLFDFDDTLLDVSASRAERARRAYQRLLSEGVDVRWNDFWYSLNALDEGGVYRRGMGLVMEDLGLTNTELGRECTGLWYFEGAEDLLRLSPGCLEVLDLLRDRYRLGIITNGPERTQWHKFEQSGLREHFELFLPSGAVGFHKPETEIFRIGLQGMEVAPSEAIFIGDHLDLDVIGAQRAGMKGVWYNPHHDRSEHPHIVPDATITHLAQVPDTIAALESANAS